MATRLLLPPAFLIISANHFLPQTTANLTSYFSSLEETHFPRLAQKHDVANAHTRMTWERIKDGAQNGRAWVNRGAENAVEKIQDVTGLKLRETFGWTQAVAQKAEVAKVVEEKVREVKDVSDRTIEETKHKVDVKKLV